ncbi:MAG: PPC domain-containing protein, partial [Cyanobacteriota bacterium]|nr:PPC domain-containing protein [Cyanobacteriota bacterium]
MNAFAGPAGLEELAASLSWAGKSSLPFPDPAAAAVLEASPSLPLNQSGELLWRNELSSLSADPSADSGAWKGDPDTDLLTGAQHESSDGPSGLSFRTAVADGAGNSLATARDIGTLSGSQSFSDWVGKSDRDDFYRFEITEASQFSATLEGLSADADLQLLSSSGAVLASSTNARAAAEMISGTISAGT